MNDNLKRLTVCTLIGALAMLFTAAPVFASSEEVHLEVLGVTGTGSGIVAECLLSNNSTQSIPVCTVEFTMPETDDPSLQGFQMTVSGDAVWPDGVPASSESTHDGQTLTVKIYSMTAGEKIRLGVPCETKVPVIGNGGNIQAKIHVSLSVSDPGKPDWGAGSVTAIPVSVTVPAKETQPETTTVPETETSSAEETTVQESASSEAVPHVVSDETGYGEAGTGDSLNVYHAESVQVTIGAPELVTVEIPAGEYRRFPVKAALISAAVLLMALFVTGRLLRYRNEHRKKFKRPES